MVTSILPLSIHKGLNMACCTICAYFEYQVPLAIDFSRGRIVIWTLPSIRICSTTTLSTKYTYNGTRRVRQLALGCESSWVKSTHDAYENTWKCGELKLYFSPSAGGSKKTNKQTNKQTSISIYMQRNKIRGNLGLLVPIGALYFQVVTNLPP